MGDQELRLKATLAGGKETAADLDKIAGAEEKVAGKTKEGAGATEEATRQQEALNAAESDYIGILTSIHPALGQFVDAGLKASKVAGDLAGQNLNAIGIWNKVTEAIKANAAALKLIGAGGLVVLAIMAIVRAFERMKEEAEAATKAIEENQRALTQLKQEEADRAQALENLANRRREGGYATAEEATAAAQMAERIQGRQSWLQAEAIRQAVAMGGGRGREQLEMLAAGIQAGKVQLEPGMAPAEREARIEAMLRQSGDQLRTMLEREAEQRRQTDEAARRQMREQEGGNIADLKGKLAQLLPAGMDAEKLARTAQAVGTAAGLESRRPEGQPVQARVGQPWTELSAAEVAALVNAMRQIEAEGPPQRAEPREAEIAKQIEELRAAVEQYERARGHEQEGYPRDILLRQRIIELEAKIGRLEQERQQITYNMQHARIVYPDAESAKRATANGENDRQRRGVG